MYQYEISTFYPFISFEIQRKTFYAKITKRFMYLKFT